MPINFKTTINEIPELIFYNKERKENGKKLFPINFTKFDFFKIHKSKNTAYKSGFYQSVPYYNKPQKKELYYKLGNDKLIIPMKYTSPNIFTIWKEDKDSIVYEGKIEHLFGGKYFHSKIDTIVQLGENKTLIGLDEGGEGGDIWINYWIGQLETESFILQDSIQQSYNGNYQIVTTDIKVISDAAIFTTKIVNDLNGKEDLVIEKRKLK